jgi:dihydroorotate dehydrogenase electron transfer subunit
VRAQIVFNEQLSSAYRHLGLSAPGFPDAFAAGQFVMLRPPMALDPFLPRAFSIYRLQTPADSKVPVVEVLYKILGKGTQCLSRMEAGQELEILGPLGNSFSVPEHLGTAILVAGGIGVPPIAALARQIRNVQCLSDRQAGAFHNCEVFLGGRTHEDILCVKDLGETGATVRITTEDGSQGIRGVITDLLTPFLDAAVDRTTRHVGPEESPNHLCLFSCGPPGMLAAVARLAEERGVPCQTSVEANMACGFGACMGCAIGVRSNSGSRSYKLVCKDGPVFDSRVIRWE